MERNIEISGNQPKVPEETPEKTTTPIRRITIVPERETTPPAPIVPVTPLKEPVPSR
jgi:hypothetical protein